MKYNANFFYDVLIKNYHYEEVNFPFCRAIRMNPIDAFRYVVFSSSGYLDLSQIENRLIIKKDYFRIFNQAEQEAIQHGIFDGKTCDYKATPNLFFEKYPYILNSDKYVVFIEYDAKLKIKEPPYYPFLRELNNKILQENLNPNDFIVTLIPLNNSPKDLEAFFEFCMVEKYRRKGYLTDSQIPFYYGVGTPDAAAYSNELLRNDIFNYLGITGATTIDLMCLKYQIKGTYNKCEDNSLVFEVKTSTIDGSQINKYKNMEVFNKAYEVIPHKTKVDSYSGLISYDDYGNEKVEESETFSTNSRDKYYSWLIKYVKCFLIANFSKEELEKFKSDFHINNTNELMSVLDSLTIREIIDKVMEG